MTSKTPLQAGDLVDVVAPGSSAPLDAIEKGIRVLEGWGLRVRIPKDLLEPATFFSNSDEKRLQHLKKALHARDSKAVWCVRGGSGTHRLLPALFKGAPPRREKLLLGFSDITSLLITVHSHWGWSSWHAPVLTQIGRGGLESGDLEILRQSLFGEKTELQFADLHPMNRAAEKLKGPLKGPLLGGNLVVFESLIGTPYGKVKAGSLLFFEDVNERGYRLDRSFVHLDQAGYFRKAKAIVLGDFTGGDEPVEAGQSERVNRIPWAFENLSVSLKIPLFRGIPVGHGNRNQVLAIGGVANLSVQGGQGLLTQKIWKG